MTDKHGAAFWEWSLSRYARDGVEPVLLRLQDEFGFNVNILLWCCWCADHFGDAPEPVFRKAIDFTSQWSANVTKPLRAARRYLKTPPPSAPSGAEALRARIKDAELKAEAVEQSYLEALAQNALQPAARGEDPRPCARRNLAAYTALIGAARLKGFTISLLETLIDRIFPETPYAPEDQD